MAIQVNGTEVISNTRGLNNIESVDSTTAATINGIVSASVAGTSEALAGSWAVIGNDFSDLSTAEPFATLGAGTYRIILVGGGGAGWTSSPVSGYGAGSGGGASGIAFFDFAWDGTTAIACTIGTGGTANNSYYATSAAGSGGASTFSVGGTVRVTVNGGAGAVANGNTRTGTASGGAGGTAALTSSHSSISSTTFRSGGRGGNCVRTGSTNTNITGKAAGGGGVDFFGNADTRGGDVNATSTGAYGSAGGGPFGAGGDVSTFANRATVSSATSMAGAGSQSSLNSNTNTYTVVSSTGGNVFTQSGPFVGGVAEGYTQSWGATGNNAFSQANRVSSTGGLLGGGGAANSSISTYAANGQSGVLFGGGGGAASARNGVYAYGGTGGLGAGGGSGTAGGGAGGSGALFVTKL